jgi:plasmid stabilization system protein ParE
MAKVIFNHLVRKDLHEVLSFYEQEGSSALADRFFEIFTQVATRASENPRFFPPVTDHLRRANLPDFPYHILFREKPWGIRVLVLRHDRRHPNFGMRRS